MIQAISKIRRSGFSYRPFGGEKTNWDNFFGEVQDVHALLRILGDGLDHVDEEHFARKVEKLKKWSNLIPGDAVPSKSASPADPDREENKS